MNNVINECADCSCNCWLATAQCIVSFSELTKGSLVKTNHVNHANSDVEDMIGELCFSQLCGAITAAIEQSNHESSNDGMMTYLQEKWVKLLSNTHFKTYYANRVASYWLNGAAIVELKSVGIVTTSNDDGDYKNQFVHAAEKQRSRLANAADAIATRSRGKFLKSFWLKSNEYDCAETECCNEKQPSTGIGFKIL